MRMPPACGAAPFARQDGNITNLERSRGGSRRHMTNLGEGNAHPHRLPPPPAREQTRPARPSLVRSRLPRRPPGRQDRTRGSGASGGVVRHKTVFFHAGNANYERCLDGRLHLVPDDDQLPALQSRTTMPCAAPASSAMKHRSSTRSSSGSGLSRPKRISLPRQLHDRECSPRLPDRVARARCSCRRRPVAQPVMRRLPPPTSAC